MNRVLTWDEVLELRDGDRVWVEHNGMPDPDGENVVYLDEDGIEIADVDGWGSWYVDRPERDELYNEFWRAWELPLMPTDEERKNAPEWGRRWNNGQA